MHERVFFRVVPSRFGEAAVVWRHSEQASRIVRILLPERGTSADLRVRHIWRHARKTRYRTPGMPCAMLEAYLEGNRVTFTLDMLDFSCVTSFQEKVLRREHRIPYGRVSTYGSLAKKVGSPGAARAVGNALAKNPFPLIIPCHRAVRGDRTLGGFQGGLNLKRALLEMEGVGIDRTGRILLEHIW
jgi:methylated-DNA-[protein]-cysteine S-methyltransferase